MDKKPSQELTAILQSWLNFIVENFEILENGS